MTPKSIIIVLIIAAIVVGIQVVGIVQSISTQYQSGTYTERCTEALGE